MKIPTNYEMETKLMIKELQLPLIIYDDTSHPTEEIIYNIQYDTYVMHRSLVKQKDVIFLFLVISDQKIESHYDMSRNKSQYYVENDSKNIMNLYSFFELKFHPMYKKKKKNIKKSKIIFF